MKIFKFSVRRTIFYVFTFIGFLSIFSISVLWIITELSEHQSRISQLRKSSFDAHRYVLKHEVKRVISYIDFTRTHNSSITEEELKQNLLQYIASLHFEHGGYVFINTFDGKALVFDGKKVEGVVDITNLTDPNGLRLFDLELKAITNPNGDYMEYEFKRMDTTINEHKLSYICGYNDWNWIIGAGLYLNHTLDDINRSELAHAKKLNSRILKIAILSAALLLIFLNIAYFLSKVVQRDFSVFNTFFNSAAKLDTRIDLKQLRVKEFIRLASTANKMLNARSLNKQQIIEQRNTMQGYLDIVGVIVVAIDVNGTITLINKMGCQILGYAEKELLGRNWFECCLSAEHAAKATQLLSNIISGKGNLKTNSVNEIITKHHEKRTIEWHNIPLVDTNRKITGVLSSGRDVTERLKAQKELRISENKYRLLFEKTSDPVFILDMSLGITDCNDAALIYFAAENHNKMTEKLLTDFSIKEKTSQSPGLIDLNLKVEEAISAGFTRFEWKHLNMKGYPCYSDISLTLIPLTNSTNLYAVIRDIKQDKEYEQELIVARQKAEQSDKLKTAFLNNISHEVRTPLNAIMGFSQLLTQLHLSKHDINDYLKAITSAGHNLIRIIDNIIDYSRYQTGEITILNNPTDLKYILINAYLKHYISVEEKGVAFTFSFDSTSLPNLIQSDEKRITQVLDHLINNALKFTDKGKIGFGYQIKEHEIVFYVADTGIGINPKDVEFIFEGFNQSDHLSTGKLYGGTGLGLSISKAIIEKMEGRIWADALQNSGTIVYFTLPYEPCNPSEKGFNQDKLTIGCISNNTLLYTTLEKQIVTLGLQSVSLPKGLNAVEFCQRPNDLALVLVDMNQANSTVLAIAKALIKMNPELPLVAILDHSSKHTKEAVLKYGFLDFIFTPITSFELNSILQHVLEAKTQHNS